MEDTQEDFNNSITITKRKKRRSSFINRRLLENQSLLESRDVIKLLSCENTSENPSVKSEKNQEVEEYRQKLKNEKQLWIEYEKQLRLKYSRAKNSEEASESQVIDLNEYLQYLPIEDRDYLETLDKKVCELDHIQKVKLPQLNKRLALINHVFVKQVEVVKLINDDFKLITKKIEDLSFDQFFDDEIWDNSETEIENSTEEHDTETHLYINGV